MKVVLEALLIALIPNGMLAILIVCLGMCVTCFIPSVHDVEHTVPATGDVCVGYVVCITTCLCMHAIQCFDCVSGADVCMGYVLLITTRLCMYKISDEM